MSGWKRGIPALVILEDCRELEEKDGKINDYNGVFAFFLLLKNTTKDKASDKPYYLVMLAKKRQLLLGRGDLERGFCKRGVWGLGCQEGWWNGGWWVQVCPPSFVATSRGTTRPSTQRQIIVGGISRPRKTCHPLKHSLSVSMYLLLSSYFKGLIVVESTREKEERVWEEKHCVPSSSFSHCCDGTEVLQQVCHCRYTKTTNTMCIDRHTPQKS